jgi:tetratricopeptide (TPR) repeat protein
LKLKPVNAAYLQQCGSLSPKIAGSSTAKLLLQAGINNDSFNPWRYYNYALWLFARGRTAQGREQLRQAMAVGPDITNACITRMLLVGLSVKDIAATIPPQTRPALYFARYLDEKGRYHLAGEFYRRAVEYTAAEKTVRPDYFYKPCNFFMRRHQYDDALRVMQKAAAKLPDNVAVRMAIASLYDRMGIRYRAIEEYQKALVLDPANRKARRLIKGLKQQN